MTGWDYTDAEYGVRVFRVNGHPVYFTRLTDAEYETYKKWGVV